MKDWVDPWERATRPSLGEDVSERMRAVRAGRSRVAMCWTGLEVSRYLFILYC